MNLLLALLALLLTGYEHYCPATVDTPTTTWSAWQQYYLPVYPNLMIQECPKNGAPCKETDVAYNASCPTLRQVSPNTVEVTAYFYQYQAWGHLLVQNGMAYQDWQYNTGIKVWTPFIIR